MKTKIFTVVIFAFLISVGLYISDSTSTIGVAVAALDSPIATPTDEPTVEPTPDPTDEPTPDPVDTPTPDPTDNPAPHLATLILTGPTAATVGETFLLSVDLRNVADDGLYGIQFEIEYDPALISVDQAKMQVNPLLSLVLISSADNAAGKITLVASKQGRVPGLTGDIPLLSFEATALAAGTATLTFVNPKASNPHAAVIEMITESHTVLIDDSATPEPTDEPTVTPTPEPTDTPTATPTSEPTDQPTPQPTDTPTPEPTEGSLSGQVILPGRALNDWSGAEVTVDGNGPRAITDPDGHYHLAGVAVGGHQSIIADAAGYLPAVCTGPVVTASETVLANVTLLSGDVNDDGKVDITDATAVGIDFGKTGSGLTADINRDEMVDIFDVVLASINYGEETQVWDCLAE